MSERERWMMDNGDVVSRASFMPQLARLWGEVDVADVVWCGVV